jgi:hypothetical protein
MSDPGDIAYKVAATCRLLMYEMIDAVPGLSDKERINVMLAAMTTIVLETIVTAYGGDQKLSLKALDALRGMVRQQLPGYLHQRRMEKDNDSTLQ